ncbi:ArsR family transcriptional regulator [Nonomuraea mesophila]|uniref:ArsR family transcriptional regulator n=2 Tax=Nonomuraea mesophila TaxID=2530382 RepID=A0A4R5FIH9_9ACTN|nr:ArsR family transcriptional regulator [Nonomuraea mesophila]
MMRETGWVSDPKAMRALAHSARLTILAHLGDQGSATATEVAESAGITPSAASYHLRMLAKYGFVEDAPHRGDGRERLWKVVDAPIGVGINPSDPPELREAKKSLITALNNKAQEEAERAWAHLDGDTDEWRFASGFSRTRIRVDAEELARLNREIMKLIEPYLARFRSQDEAPSGARIAEAQVSLFPVAKRVVPGLPTEDHDASAPADDRDAGPSAEDLSSPAEDGDASPPVEDRGARSPAEDRDAGSSAERRDGS